MNDYVIGSKYGIALSKMIDRIVWAAEDALYPDSDAPNLRLMVIEFMGTHGEDAVIKLYGFIRYIQTSDKTEDEKTKALRQVISHDLLKGRNDKFMLPRSDSYEEFAYK